MDMSKYRELFLSEAREHINGLSQLVVTLEQEPGNRETIDALFREAHSIKGMAATMGFNNTARLSHHLEDLLDGFRNSGDIPSVTIDYLLEGIDLLDSLLDDAVVVAFPYTHIADLDYQLIGRVSRFDAEPDGTAVLEVQWGVIASRDEFVIQPKRMRYAVSAGQPGDYEALTRAMSEVLQQFSRDVAESLRTVLLEADD
jgi:chemotaxis protein histidine kinase CheA